MNEISMQLCTVCGEQGTSEHSEPDGSDTFALCDTHLAECQEVAREGQYVTEEDVLNGF